MALRSIKFKIKANPKYVFGSDNGESPVMMEYHNAYYAVMSYASGEKPLPDAVELLSDETFAKGAYLESFTECVRVMSDVWEDQRFYRYWNEKEGKPEIYSAAYNEVVFADVDASEEVKAKYAAYKAAKEEAERKANEEAYAKRVAAEAEKEAKKIAYGKMVKVNRGRTNRGAVGKVLWRGGEWDKVLLGVGDEKDAKGRYVKTLYAYARNVDVVLPEKKAAA